MSILPKIIRTKLLPSLAQYGNKHFVITSSNMKQRHMPDGVVLEPRPIKGKRVAVRNRRFYKNSRYIIARWPQSNLVEIQTYKLMCVLRGAINYPIDKYSLHCGSGHFIFLPPRLPHFEGNTPYFDSYKSTFCEILFFILHPNALQYWISRSDAKQRQTVENAVVIDQSIISVFRLLMREIYESEQSLPVAQNALLMTFFSLLKREVGNDRSITLTDRNSGVADALQASRIGHSDFRAELEFYIKNNIEKRLTIDKAAQAMYWSRAQFTRLVRRETGMSFNELVSKHRLKKAKVLLRESEWNISFISESLGFANPDYFRIFFRKYTGKSPSEFRRQ